MTCGCVLRSAVAFGGVPARATFVWTLVWTSNGDHTGRLEALDVGGPRPAVDVPTVTDSYDMDHADVVEDLGDDLVSPIRKWPFPIPPGRPSDCQATGEDAPPHSAHGLGQCRSPPRCDDRSAII